MGIVPRSSNLKISSMVYSHFNHCAAPHGAWDGWNNIWCLKIAPKAKHFIWLMLHNGVKTYDYLYNMNLGPQNFFIWCNLEYEIAEHLFNLCPKSQLIWNLISNDIGLTIAFTNGLVLFRQAKLNFFNMLLLWLFGLFGKPDAIVFFKMKS